MAVEPRGYGWTPWLAFGMALSVTFGAYFFGRARDTAFELARSREALRAQSVELTRLNEAMAIVGVAETRVVGFGGEKAPRGRVHVNRGRGVLLTVSNLPALGPGKTFEMWITPKGGKPVPAGVFAAGGDHTATHVRSGPVDANVAAVTVTVEESGGAAQPTSAPIITATVEGPDKL